MAKSCPGHQEQPSQDRRSQPLPADNPVKPREPVELDAHLARQVLEEVLGAVEPCDDHYFEQSKEKEVPGGGRGVEQGEHVDAGWACEG